MNEVERLQQEVETLREQLAQERSHNAALQEQIKLHLQRRFAASSEKVSVDQLGLFNEAESLVAEDEEAVSETSATVKGHQRTRKPRVSIPDNYPREEIVYDLADDEKVCPQ